MVLCVNFVSCKFAELFQQFLGGILRISSVKEHHHLYNRQFYSSFPIWTPFISSSFSTQLLWPESPVLCGVELVRMGSLVSFLSSLSPLLDVCCGFPSVAFILVRKFLSMSSLSTISTKKGRWILPNSFPHRLRRLCFCPSFCRWCASRWLPVLQPGALPPGRGLSPSPAASWGLLVPCKGLFAPYTPESGLIASSAPPDSALPRMPHCLWSSCLLPRLLWARTVLRWSLFLMALAVLRVWSGVLYDASRGVCLVFFS